MKCFISDDFFKPLSSNTDKEDIRAKTDFSVLSPCVECTKRDKIIPCINVYVKCLCL